MARATRFTKSEKKAMVDIYPKDVRGVISVLFEEQDWLSDGYGWYLPSGDEGDRELVRIARRINKAAKKDA